MKRHRFRGFTLIELLVVVSIIVILLAILIPGLQKALKAAERSKCAANQRNIAQQLAGYSLESKRTFPNSTGASPTSGLNQNQTGVVDPSTSANVNTTSNRLAYSMDYRSSDPSSGTLNIQGQAPVATGTQDAAAVNGRTALGLGILAAMGRLPQTELGEIGHCPSLDTSSASPSAGAAAATVNFGTDNIHAEGAGLGFYVDPAQTAARMVGSFYYRGTSWARTRGGSGLRYNQAGKSTFALTSDFFDRRYGIRFHHLDGYNVSYGDGHASYYSDPQESIEKNVIGDTQYGAGNNVKEAPINGYDKPEADEAVFNYLGRK